MLNIHIKRLIKKQGESDKTPKSGHGFRGFIMSKYYTYVTKLLVIE